MGTSKKRTKKSNSKKKNTQNKTANKSISTNNIQNKRKTDYDIPTISFKGSMIILLGALVGTLVIPFILSLVGVSNNLAIVIGNMTATAYSIAYVRYFVETKRGYTKKFFRTYALFAVGFGIISFFWLYLNSYI